MIYFMYPQLGCTRRKIQSNQPFSFPRRQLELELIYVPRLANHSLLPCPWLSISHSPPRRSGPSAHGDLVLADYRAAILNLAGGERFRRLAIRFLDGNLTRFHRVIVQWIVKCAPNWRLISRGMWEWKLDSGRSKLILAGPCSAWPVPNDDIYFPASSHYPQKPFEKGQGESTKFVEGLRFPINHQSTELWRQTMDRSNETHQI